MRAKDDNLDNRTKRILQVVIHHYIKTTKPVGSKVIADNYNFGLSTATIRNILAELEKEGYLTHPYTSSGRVPTDSGYRLYVDTLKKVQNLTLQEMERIRREYSRMREEQEDVLRKTTHMLSLLSNYAGFVLVPKIENDRLKHIEIVKLKNKRILLILVTDNGEVRHKTFLTREELTSSYLNNLSGVLKEKLAGEKIDRVPGRVLDIIEEEYGKYYAEINMLKNIFKEVIRTDGSEVYFESSSSMLDTRNTDNYEQIKSILEAMEEKKFHKYTSVHGEK